MLKLYVFVEIVAILLNVNTLQSILTVVGAKCKVSFDVPNSLASCMQLSVVQKVVSEEIMSCYLHQHKSTAWTKHKWKGDVHKFV